MSFYSFIHTPTGCGSEKDIRKVTRKDRMARLDPSVRPKNKVWWRKILTQTKITGLISMAGYGADSVWLTGHDRGGTGHGHMAKHTRKLQGSQSRNRACTASFSYFAISLTWLRILACNNPWPVFWTSLSFPPLLHILCLLFSYSLFISAFWSFTYFLLPCNSVFLSPPSVHSDYLSKLAISWLLYRDDVSPCPRVHQVGFRLLYLVKPKLTAGLVWVLLDLTKGLGFVLMWVNLVWFIAGLSKKINGGPFESKSLIALCSYVSSLWVFSPSLSPSFSFPACLPPALFSPRLFSVSSREHCDRECQWYFVVIRGGFFCSH